jgi:hypothetical protein
MTRVSAVVGPLLAILAVLLLTVLPSSASGGPSVSVAKAGIGVRVLNEAGKLVPGAEVVLLTANGKPLAKRHTNKDGRCLFAPVKPGDYLVRAHRIGQGKGQSAATAVEGELAKITVNLEKQ